MDERVFEMNKRTIKVLLGIALLVLTAGAPYIIWPGK